MALSKKKSRIITLDKVKYRWVVSPDSGYNVFVAEQESVKGRKIEVYFPMSEEHDLEKSLKIIKPADAAIIVRSALSLGWNPEETGSPLVFDFLDNKLEKRFKKG